jgi:hypothetical protein
MTYLSVTRSEFCRFSTYLSVSAIAHLLDSLNAKKPNLAITQKRMMQRYNFALLHSVGRKNSTGV